MRKSLKNSNKHEKVQNFLEKYKIAKEFTSTTRRMISRGAFIGIFIAMIPMPFQMIAVLVFMPFFKYNVPIAVIMCWITNPFTMPFIYYIEYLTGSYLLGFEMVNVEVTLEWFQNNFSNILIPLYVGALFYSITLSSIIYYLITHLWIRSVHNDRKDSKSEGKNLD